MEELIELVGEGYVVVTLASVIVGYLITTTPYLKKLKDFVPLIVTVFGAVLAVIIYGKSVEVIVIGALAGILSTGLYELFGKGIKNLGEYLIKKGGKDDVRGDA